MADHASAPLVHWRLAALVALRHWRIFRRDLLANVSPTLVDPFLYVTVFGFWLGAQMPTAGGRTYLEFIAPGIAVMTALFTAFFEGSYGFFVRLEFEHVFKALLTTPVGPRDILAGEVIWLGAKGAIMSSVVALVLLALGVVHGQYLVLIPLLGVITGVTCGAIGLVASCYVRNINQFQMIYAWIISPMFFLSGIFVPIAGMPPLFQHLCWLSPFYHSVQIAQATLWAENVGVAWAVHGSILVLMGVVVIAWAGAKILPRLSPPTAVAKRPRKRRVT